MKTIPLPRLSPQRSVLLRPLLLLVVLAGFPLVGCNFSSGDLPEIGQVFGTVTLDGKPLPNVEVMFYPQDGGRMSIGVTDANGQYELEYMRGAKIIYGAKVGEHNVSLLAAQDDDSDEPTAAAIPKQYRGSKSELRATVQSGKNPPIDFALSSQ